MCIVSKFESIRNDSSLELAYQDSSKILVVLGLQNLGRGEKVATFLRLMVKLIGLSQPAKLPAPPHPSQTTTVEGS